MEYFLMAILDSWSLLTKVNKYRVILPRIKHLKSKKPLLSETELVNVQYLKMFKFSHYKLVKFEWFNIEFYFFSFDFSEWYHFIAPIDNENKYQKEVKIFC